MMAKLYKIFNLALLAVFTFFLVNWISPLRGGVIFDWLQWSTPVIAVLLRSLFYLKGGSPTTSSASDEPLKGKPNFRTGDDHNADPDVIISNVGEPKIRLETEDSVFVKDKAVWIASV